MYVYENKSHQYLITHKLTKLSFEPNYLLFSSINSEFCETQTIISKCLKPHILCVVVVVSTQEMDEAAGMQNCNCKDQNISPVFPKDLCQCNAPSSIFDLQIKPIRDGIGTGQGSNIEYWGLEQILTRYINPSESI